MELNDLSRFLGDSPTVRLLRAQNGAIILHFLHHQFKAQQRITIAHEQLLAELDEFQDQLRSQEAFAEALPGDPNDYLNLWCKSDVRFLQRYFPSGSEEPVYQLTSHTEAAIRFARESLESEDQFISAESRMLMIVETLKELSIFAHDDVDRQLAALEEEKARIDERMERIRSTGHADTIDPTQVREKFGFAVDLLQRVLGDFRQVEDKFKEITREVQDRQMAGENRGGLLEYVLDAETVLKESDQGKSFYGFVNLILSPAKQERLRQLVEDVHEVDSLEECRDGLEMLRYMMPALTAEAEQVMQTNQRLSASIKRLLDGKVADERRKVALTMDEIFSHARQIRNQPPDGDVITLDIDGQFKPFSTFSRIFWSPSAEVEAVDMEDDSMSDEEVGEAFDMFAEMRHLDWNGMRDLVNDITKREESISLPTLMERYPPQSGVIEVLGYVQIAQDDDHVVLTEETDDIPLIPDEAKPYPQKFVRVPRVIFRSN